jgi:hypothetical protein
MQTPPGTRQQADGTFEILKPRLEAQGRPMTVAGTFTALGVRIKRMGAKAGGNQKTAGWRTRHGGAWCSPVSRKFKV